MDNLQKAGLIFTYTAVLFALFIYAHFAMNAQEYEGEALSLHEKATSGKVEKTESYAMSYCAMVLCSKAEKNLYDIGFDKNSTAENNRTKACATVKRDFLNKMMELYG